MIKLLTRYYLLDKNVTSRIREIFQFYEKHFKKPFNKKLGFSSSQLIILANTEWDSSHEKNHYELMIESYEELKRIDLENVLLYPFFCIIESLFKDVVWDQYDQLTKLDIDREQISKVVTEELDVLNSFFNVASSGKMPVDLEGQIISFFNKNNNELLQQQNTNLNEILHIHLLIENFKARYNGKLPYDARKHVIEEVKKRFEGPAARIYRFTLLLSLYEEYNAVNITKIQRSSKNFSIYNYFFDVFFITKLFDLSITIEKVNERLRYQFLEIPSFKRKVLYLTFDKPLRNFIDQHLNPSQVKLQAVGEGFFVEIKASPEIEKEPYFKEIEFLFSNRSV